jgi:hypothetical protein
MLREASINDERADPDAEKEAADTKSVVCSRSLWSAHRPLRDY